MQVQMPAARRLAQLPDQYADGGLVARMKSADAGPAAFGSRGLSQLRDMVPKMAAMGYPQQAAAPAPAPAPASDPRAAQLMAMIPKMEAMGFKQQPQMLARGGMVRGPGTGTSDSIATEAEPGTYIMPADSTAAIGPSALEKMGTVPVRLSDGEFKLPPAQVMAIGEAVLKLMKDATHTPVNGEDGGQTDAEVDDDDKEGARGFNPADRMAEMPEQMFADGGLIENDVTRVGNSYSGGNVSGGITVNGAAPAGTFSENPAGRLAAAPAPRPAPTTISVTRATPAVGAQDPAAGFASPVDRMATAPAPAPMGWQARQDQRSADVSSSSITNRPEWRRYADGGMVEDDLQKRLMQIPTGGMQAPQPDGSQNSPLNNEVGRNVMNTLSALPGAGGLASRGGAQAARAATGGAVSAERVIPAAWEVVQDGGSLVGRAGPAAQQMGQIGSSGGGALTRAASMSQGAPQAALSGPGGQLATRAAGEVGEVAAGFAPRARTATQWADVVEPAALGAPTVGQGAAAAGQAAPSAARGFGRYAAGAAGLGGAALIAGSAGDSGASQATPNMSPSQPFAQTAGTLQTGAAAQSPAAAAMGAMPITQGAVTRTGNSYTGPANIRGDVTINGAAPGGGAISAQNMAAADALAGRQAQESLARVLGQMPSTAQGVQVPTIRTGANDWQARKDLENAATSAASITNNGGRFDQTGGKNPAALAYRAALETDNALRASAPGLAQQAMREQGDTQRAGLQVTASGLNAAADRQNALERTLIGERGANARAGLSAAATLDAAKVRAGAGANKPLNDVQSKALQFGTRMQAAGSVLDGLASKGVDQPGLIKRAADAVGIGGAANWTQSGEQQQVEQAQRDFINAVLRRESGAAIADSEFSNARQQYFPQVGDSPEVIAQKRKNREIATAGVLAEVPDSETRVNQVMTTANGNTPAPKGLPSGMSRQVGTSGGRPVYEDAQGNRFIGG